jgi:hypothetical protein
VEHYERVEPLMMSTSKGKLVTNLNQPYIAPGGGSSGGGGGSRAEARPGPLPTRGGSSSNIGTLRKTSYETTSGNLADHGWFHGCVPRKEASELLLKEGDFLVRESVKRAGELALSVRGPAKVTHFLVNQETPGFFAFEGDRFMSVAQLCHHYRKHGLTVTKRSTSKLVNPILRSVHLFPFPF